MSKRRIANGEQKMIIAISGLSGCGKNTVGEKVAAKLGLRPIQFSFKDEAKRRGVSLMDIQALASRDSALDKQLDDKIVAEASKGNCVIMTWLGPWMVKDADLRVWLDASEEERARRVSGRDKMSLAEALEHVRKRDANNRERYKRFYGINIDDRSIFDLVVNTGRFNPEQSSEIIVAAAKQLRYVKKYELG